MIRMQTPEKFNREVLSLLTKNMSVMEAIIYYCEKNNLEYETISQLIGSELKQRLREEAENLNLLPKSSKLPI